MDTSLPPRPVRRHAHVCRVCNLAFTCKAELLEHEQEAHTAGSGSNSYGQSSKRRLVSALTGGSDSAGSSPGKLHAVAKKADVGTSQAGNVVARAANLPVDHEEVYESCRKMKSADTVVHETVVSVQNPRASSVHAEARSHDQVGDQVAESVSEFGTTVVSGSPSQMLSQATVTAVQNTDTLNVPTSGTLFKGIETIKSPKGDVIKALGLKRKGGVRQVVTTSSNDHGVDENDTKPPVSESITDISGTAVDCGHVIRYEILGSINEEQGACVLDSDATARKSRNVGMQSVLLPALTKEEATNCVAGLHHGDSYPASVHSDELQLLAAVSSTRSRDIVTEPERPSAVPAYETREQQQTSDIVVTDPTDIVEQEVVLETTMYDGEQSGLSGRLAKKRASAAKPPVCLVKLPMTPHQFTSTDGAKKRMVAITVARAPRMVSVLLRNRNNTGTDEPQEWQESAEASVEELVVQKTENITSGDVATSTDSVAESVSAINNLSAEAATAAQAIAFGSEAGDAVKSDVDSKVEPNTEVCLYCELPFPSDEMAEHVSLNHVCEHCGRKFRQPMNLRKVTLTFCIGYAVVLFLLHAAGCTDMLL